jgi:hypothetical protein
VPGEAARLIDSLHARSYGQARALLAKLSDEDLAEGIRTAELNLAFAVGDHVVGLGRAGPAVALAEAALAGRTVAEPDNVIRALLRMASPAVDRALFATRKSGQVWLIRRAILGDRRGPDGLPVIDAAIAAQVIDEVRGGRATFEVVESAAIAADPAIARAAFDWGMQNGSQPIMLHALATLCEFGLREQVWRPDVRAVVEAWVSRSGDDDSIRNWRSVVAMGEGVPFQRDELPAMMMVPTRSNLLHGDEGGGRYRRLAPPWDRMLSRAADLRPPSRFFVSPHGNTGMDEAARRDDIPAAVRTVFEERYARAAWLRPRPDLETVRLVLADADRLAAAEQPGALGELVRRGVVGGTLQASDVVATVPLADVLPLLIPGDTAEHNCFTVRRDAVPEPALRWAAEQIRSAVAAVLDVPRADPAFWAALWRRAPDWTGTLPALVSSLAGLPAPASQGEELSAASPSRYPPTAPEHPVRGVDPVVALVSLSPAEAIAGLLAAVPVDRDATGFVTWLLSGNPLIAALAEFALGPQGTLDMRRSVAGNAAADEALLWGLVAFEPAEPAILAQVFTHPAATEDLRVAAVVRSHAAGGLHPKLAGHLAHTAPGYERLLPALESGDAMRIHTALHAVLTTVDSGHRAIAYAALAALGAVESVWALELERVGTLDQAGASVRASMAAGDAGPLLAVVDDARTAAMARRRALGT